MVGVASFVALVVVVATDDSVVVAAVATVLVAAVATVVVAAVATAAAIFALDGSVVAFVLVEFVGE